MEPVPDLTDTPIHLGLGPTALPVEDFAWDPEALARYEQRFASDGDEGRLVTMFDVAADWDAWERHPAGDEVVVVVAGRFRMIQEIDGEERPVEVGAGGYVINGPGVWHTVDVLEPGRALFITPGRGTGHKPR
ncbi:MAG: cupin domain-containing protein [Iamia sp.]